LYVCPYSPAIVVWKIPTKPGLDAPATFMDKAAEARHRWGMLSVLIVNARGKRGIELPIKHRIDGCLESIRKQVTVPGEAIVVGTAAPCLATERFSVKRAPGGSCASATVVLVDVARGRRTGTARLPLCA
jgi:hypothetical protein